nr:MAG TPA: hypothetical protein [Bacteriophage sp.]
MHQLHIFYIMFPLFYNMINVFPKDIYHLIDLYN